MPTTTINTAQSFSGWHEYASGNGLDKLAQARIESLPATATDGLVDGFEEGKRARLVSSNLSGKNIKKQAKKIDKIAARRPSVKKPVLSVTINLKPGENLRSHESVEMINDFRRAMGLVNCPFAAFEHREKPHQHFHVAFSLIDFDGQPVRCSHDRLQARTWARETEVKYNLTPTPERSPRRLMTGAENEKFERDGTLPLFVRMQNHIDQNLNNSAGQFVELLEAKNIGVIVRFEKGKPVGISFATDEKKYAGGKLGTEFTWGGLVARGMDYNPARDMEKLVAASERSVAKFPAQIVVPEKPKPGKKSAAPLEKSEQNSEQKSEQKTEQISQAVESASLEKTPEQTVDNSSQPQEVFVEKTVADSVNEKLSVEIPNTRKIVLELTPVETVKQSEKQSELFASPSIETQNPAKADGEIIPLANESKLLSTNRISGVNDDEQKGAEPETIILPELPASGASKSNARAENTTVKTTEESASVPTEKITAITEIDLHLSSIPEIADESENVNTKPKIRDFSIGNREHLFDQLVAETNEELKRSSGRELSYPQEKGLKAMYRIQSENKTAFKQVIELKVLQQTFAEKLPQPKSFFEANVIKIDNGSESDKSEILRRQIERVNKSIELKANQKNEFENSDSLTNQTKTSAQIDSENRLAERPKAEEATGFISPLDALSHSDQFISKNDVADRLQERVKQSLDEQEIKLKPPAEKFLNDTINGWGNCPPTDEESRKVEKILENDGDNFKPANKLEAVSLIFARAEEKERDEISFELAADAEAKSQVPADKEINHREINSGHYSVTGKSAMSDELSVPLKNINFAKKTDDDQTDDRRQYLVNEIVRISRESAARQQIEVSPQAWEALRAEFTSDEASKRSASQSQKQELALREAAIPKEERIDVEHASKLEAVHLILKFSPVDYRDAIVRETLANYVEPNEAAERQNFVAPAVIETAQNSSRLPNRPNQSKESEIREVQRKFSAQLAFHKREVAESRVKDFGSIHENAEKYASLAARQQKERNNSLSLNAVTEIWNKKYKEAYQMQWENNRDLRINRRENEIREAVAISAKIPSINKPEKEETALNTKTRTEAVEKTSVDEKVVFLMQNVRQSNEEWMQAKDVQSAPRLPNQSERLMQFFIERDHTAAPNEKTVETADFIADANGIKPPQFTNELDAKAWVMKSLPDTGKQLFLENYIEQVQSNASQMLVEMQKIQLNESMQIIRLQAEQSNQQLNQTESNKIWQSLQQSTENPVDSQTAEIINQFQSNNKNTDKKNTELISPISQLDAIHTILTKGSDSEREETTETKIETAYSEVRQEQAQVESENQSAGVQKSQVLVQKQAARDNSDE